ncbi:MAG: PspC domain-containing protein [Sphaerochaetaceae bacterium]|jgi:phage shock protein C
MEYRSGERYRDHMHDEYREGYRDGIFDHKPHALRRSRNGILLGVCQGFADWLAIPAWIIRVATFIAFCATGFFPVGFAYIVAAVLMKPEY